LSLLSELQNSGGGTDISTHIAASTTSYYLEVTTKNSFNRRPISSVSWHTGKSAQDIYAMALTILQVGQPTIQLPPNPDFNSLSPEEKDWIYQDLHNQINSLVLQRKSFAQRALLRGDTGPALESGLAIQEFVIAFVCRFQVILLHGYINFLTIDDLRQ
jgi:hypothetical protein